MQSHFLVDVPPWLPVAIDGFFVHADNRDERGEFTNPSRRDGWYFIAEMSVLAEFQVVKGMCYLKSPLFHGDSSDGYGLLVCQQAAEAFADYFKQEVQQALQLRPATMPGSIAAQRRAAELFKAFRRDPKFVLPSGKSFYLNMLPLDIHDSPITLSYSYRPWKAGV
jgi:hypothetical protein